MQDSTPKTSDYRYQSFLIRFWQDGEHSLWRGSAKHVATGEMLFFDSLEKMFIYLISQTSGCGASECGASECGASECGASGCGASGYGDHRALPFDNELK